MAMRREWSKPKRRLQGERTSDQLIGRTFASMSSPLRIKQEIMIIMVCPRTERPSHFRAAIFAPSAPESLVKSYCLCEAAPRCPRQCLAYPASIWTPATSTMEATLSSELSRSGDMRTRRTAHDATGTMTVVVVGARIGPQAEGAVRRTAVYLNDSWTIESNFTVTMYSRHYFTNGIKCQQQHSYLS